MTAPTSPSPPTAPRGGDHAGAVYEMFGETTPLRVLLRDIWKERSLFLVLARKDFRSRYRSATFGVLWSVFLPLLQGTVYAFVFVRVLRIGLASGESYPVFVLSGTAVWAFCAQSLQNSTGSIVDNSAIASKVYFPRAILPAVPVLAGVVGFGITLAIVVALMPFFGVVVSPRVLLLLAVMALSIALSVAAGIVLSIMHVYFRDVRFIVTAALSVAVYSVPVVYPIERALRYKSLLVANPLTGPLQLTRYAIFGEAGYVLPSVLVTVGWTVVLVLIGLAALRRHERLVADRM